MNSIFSRSDEILDKLDKDNIKYMQRQGYDITNSLKERRYIEKCSVWHDPETASGGFQACSMLSLLFASKYAEYEKAPCVARPMFRLIKLKGLGKAERIKLKYCPFCGFHFNSKVAYES